MCIRDRYVRGHALVCVGHSVSVRYVCVCVVVIAMWSVKAFQRMLFACMQFSLQTGLYTSARQAQGDVHVHMHVLLSLCVCVLYCDAACRHRI